MNVHENATVGETYWVGATLTVGTTEIWAGQLSVDIEPLATLPDMVCAQRNYCDINFNYTYFVLNCQGYY